jgi:quinolinate synthase
MKMNTLDKLRDCLRDLAPQILIPEELRARAGAPIRRMLELSRG